MRKWQLGRGYQILLKDPENGHIEDLHIYISIKNARWYTKAKGLTHLFIVRYEE